MNKQVLFLFDFKLISKDNEKIQNKKGRYFLSTKYKNFEKLIKYSALQQMQKINFEPYGKTDSIQMTIRAYFKTKVHADLFNLPKSLSDSLQGTVYPNDRQIKTGTIYVEENADRVCFTVHIKQLPGA